MVEAAAAVEGLKLVVPREYPIVILACVVLCIECFVFGMIFVAPARVKTFNAEFMKQFEDEHEKAFPGSKPAFMGFPDAGDGRYSQKLEYKDWVEFNNAMRVHQNFIEQLPMILAVLVFSGLYLPKLSAAVGIINAVARVIYAIMYKTSGSDARKIGAVAGSLPLYILGICAFFKAVHQACE